MRIELKDVIVAVIAEPRTRKEVIDNAVDSRRHMPGFNEADSREEAFAALSSALSFGYVGHADTGDGRLTLLPRCIEEGTIEVPFRHDLNYEQERMLRDILYKLNSTETPVLEAAQLKEILNRKSPDKGAADKIFDAALMRALSYGYLRLDTRGIVSRGPRGLRPED